MSRFTLDCQKRKGRPTKHIGHLYPVQHWQAVQALQALYWRTHVQHAVGPVEVVVQVIIDAELL